MRLLLDEHLDKVIAARLRDRGFDALALTDDERLLAAADRNVLERAVADRRAVATYNVRDFRVLGSERLTIEGHHFGLILLSARRYPQGKVSVGPLVEALATLLTGAPADDALLDREVWL